ncbi:hypothetical protein ACROYT_G024217 [Oculina patagonica]
MQNIITKDVATPRIEESLLKANSLGLEKLLTFVKERLMTPEADRHHKKLRDPLPKNKAPTFSSLYEVQKKESEKSAAIKADRNILQRIITAYDAGRSVDLPRILSHDIMAVPLAITDTNGQLRTGNKSVMIEKLSSGTERPRDFDRIDVTFDRYRESSIKCATRKKRSRGHAPIRRVFEDGSVPLPKAWSTFLALDENKVDLARFLPENLIAGAPADKIIIVGGGFEEEDTVKCSRSNIDIRGLKGFHEEADTRMILHCVHSDAEFLVVSSQDTDVFLLLVSHFDKMSCKQLWMKAGTSKKPNSHDSPEC